MTLISVPNTFANNTIIDNDPLNANFAAIVNALSGIVDTIEFVFNFNGTSPVLILNQRGSGEIIKFQSSGTDLVKINNNGQIQSTVATGTAPLIVASSFKVANLNADQIDGLEAAAFVPIAGGVLTGFLTLHASPTANLHAANKLYVDTVVGNTFAAGTKFLFGGAIPAGWTRSDASEDRLIKLAKSGETIGAAGGQWEISGLSSGDTTLNINQIPSHSHDFTYNTIGLTGGGAGNSVHQIFTTGLPITITTANSGSGQAHSHTVSSNGSWIPRYEIWVVATKN